jgi:hypothetical protein
MISMNGATPQAAPVPYKDRHAGLICFGVLELLLALMALLGVASILFVAVLGTAANPALNRTSLIPGALVYVCAGVFFGTMGIGSIWARRWARALMLVVSSIWLVTGVIVSIAAFWIVPFMLERIQAGVAAGGQNSANAAQTTSFVMGCMMVTLGIVYLLLPLAFVLFYRSPHVKATCEARDPQLRWTDRCPLPVLASSFLYGIGAVALLFIAVTYRLLALFGVIIDGLPALVLCLILAAILAAVTLGSYRLEPWAWWTAVAIAMLGVASSLVTALRPLDWRDVYQRMGMGDQYQLLGLDKLWQGDSFLWLACLSTVPWLFYLVWTRRYFFRPPPPLPTYPVPPAA